ncbi:unnamed protein product [Lactuca saligna]|uniref:5'-3' DNA helicase ZGRF1-like N-terminal domain-containing protein n=1 Tax=Lactuca saligna TaxID=75948 RepID=A0AA36E9K1_LACSI|nr:unnamed protein product [Lactuca saligna]
MSNSKTSKVSSRIGKTSSINLSPSQKIIREFKKREVKKYCSPPSYPDTSNDDSTEWQVLYTTQLTQKAKKFHDGILKVLISVLRGRQAILYDETRTQLESRFLKKEETITTGESMKFDGHIVDIIELNDHKPRKDTNVDGRNCYKQNIMPSKNHNDHLDEYKYVVIELLQTLTPYMQSTAAEGIVRIVDSECSRKTSREQEKENFSMELRNTAFMDACERICPVRAAGHDCGCLPVLSRLVMEECMVRLDVQVDITGLQNYREVMKRDITVY